MTSTQTIRYRGVVIQKRVTEFFNPYSRVTEYIALGKDFPSLAAAKQAIKANA